MLNGSSRPAEPRKRAQVANQGAGRHSKMQGWQSKNDRKNNNGQPRQ